MSWKLGVAKHDHLAAQSPDALRWWHDEQQQRPKHTRVRSVHMLCIKSPRASALCAPRTHQEGDPRHTRHTKTQAAEPPDVSLAIKGEDSEADRPSGMSRKHRIHSRFYWFTEFCNSQCLSHFAAPFISVQAKTFITEGCKKGRQGTNPAMHWKR